MRGGKIVLIYIILLFLAFPGYALSIDEVVAEAKKSNPEILAAKARWEASKAKAVKVSTWPDPQFELMYEQIPQVGGVPEEAQMKMYGFSQMVPFPGKLTLKRWEVEYLAKVAEEKYRAKQNEIVSKVKAAYYAFFLVDRSIAINARNKGLLRKFAKIAEAKYVVGSATQHDVLKAQIALSLLANDLITLEQKRQTAGARLNTLLDRDPNSKINVSSSLVIPEFSFSVDELEKKALANRPELKAGRYALKSSEIAHTLAKLQYLPDFKLKLLQREMKASGLNGWNASIMLNLPLWFWREGAAVSEAGAKRETAEAAYNNMENMVRFEVQDAWVKVDSAERLVKLFKTSIIPQADQALRSATTAYEAEKVDFLTLINSQKTLEDAELKYYKLLADLGTNLANLERIIGGKLTDSETSD